MAVAQRWQDKSRDRGAQNTQRGSKSRPDLRLFPPSHPAQQWPSKALGGPFLHPHFSLASYPWPASHCLVPHVRLFFGEGGCFLKPSLYGNGG